VENIKLSKMKEFIDEYLGIPYIRYGRDKRGIDCIGLVIKWMEKEGIKLPDFSNAIDDNSEDFKKWFHISSKNYIKVDDYTTGDIVIIIQDGKQHAGIVIDKSRFIHASIKHGVVVSYIYYFKEINGYFRKI